MNIILLGAPGAGKGTQASKIADKYKLLHISTGDIFRANIKGGTEIGKLAKSYIDAGKLVPDEVTCKIVEDRLTWDDAGNGYMLDGFPRNIYQAEQLDKFAKVDLCLNIDVDEKLLMDRICGRRVCACGESYHVSTLTSARTITPKRLSPVWILITRKPLRLSTTIKSRVNLPPLPAVKARPTKCLRK